MAEDNKYDPDKHETFVQCPRERRCGRKNAPPDSDEFAPSCYNCGTHLNIQPVEIGQEMKLHLYDIHQSGAGVGRTDDGFVILTQDSLPDAVVTVRVTKVHQNHAEAEVIEKHEMTEEDEIIIEALKDGRDPQRALEDEDEEEEEEDGDDDHRLGSRDNYFGEDERY